MNSNEKEPLKKAVNEGAQKASEELTNRSSGGLKGVEWAGKMIIGLKKSE